MPLSAEISGTFHGSIFLAMIIVAALYRRHSLRAEELLPALLDAGLAIDARSPIGPLMTRAGDIIASRRRRRRSMPLHAQRLLSPIKAHASILFFGYAT